VYVLSFFGAGFVCPAPVDPRPSLTLSLRVRSIAWRADRRPDLTPNDSLAPIIHGSCRRPGIFRFCAGPSGIVRASFRVTVCTGWKTLEKDLGLYGRLLPLWSGTLRRHGAGDLLEQTCLWAASGEGECQRRSRIRPLGGAKTGHFGFGHAARHEVAASQPRFPYSRRHAGPPGPQCPSRQPDRREHASKPATESLTRTLGETTTILASKTPAQRGRHQVGIRGRNHLGMKGRLRRNRQSGDRIRRR